MQQFTPTPEWKAYMAQATHNALAPKRPPSKLLTDPNFKYTPADHTDISKTFDRLCPGWRKKRG